MANSEGFCWYLPRKAMLLANPILIIPSCGARKVLSLPIWQFSTLHGPGHHKALFWLRSTSTTNSLSLVNLQSSTYNKKKMVTKNTNITPMLFFHYYSEKYHCQKGLSKSNFCWMEIKISTKSPVFASLFVRFTVSPKTIIKDQTINYVAKVVI